MRERSIDLIDHAAQTTYRWIDELHAALPWDDRHKTLRLLRATLHALRDWLQVSEAVQLGAQLPTLVRGLYYEGWKPQNSPVRQRSRDHFLIRVGTEMAPDLVFEIEEAVAAVFAFLTRNISTGEIADVLLNLPSDMRSLWKGK